VLAAGLARQAGGVSNEGPISTDPTAASGIRGPKSWRSVWLGLSGGTVLSAVGFVGLALFEQYNGCLTELRNDLKHFNETAAEFVKKDSLHRCYEQLRECRADLQAARAERAHQERQRAADEQARGELTREVQRLRERLAAVEGRQAATPAVLAPGVLTPGAAPVDRPAMSNVGRVGSAVSPRPRQRLQVRPVNRNLVRC
jgi:hypothetical protein